MLLHPSIPLHTIFSSTILSPPFQDKIIQLLEQRHQEDIRAMRAADQEFRMTQQQKTMRREWDLNDPHATRREQPVRHEDDDGEHLGPSSLQKFTGEDLTHSARKQLQAEQMRQWAEQQQEHKLRMREEAEATHRMQELRELEMAQRAAEIEAAEQEARRALLRATQEYNLALAEEKKQRLQDERMQEEEEGLAELAAQIHGSFLSEQVEDSAASSRSDAFKGMTPQQLEEIRRTQEQQMTETQRRRQRALEEEEEDARQMELMSRQILLQERQADRLRREQQRQQAEENRRLAEQQRQRREQERKARNAIDSSFFSQFNTSTR